MFIVSSPKSNKWQQVKIELSRREGEGEREDQIKGVNEGAQERIRNGVGRKWPLARTPENLGIWEHATNVNQIGYGQILGGSKIAELCRDFHALNEA